MAGIDGGPILGGAGCGAGSGSEKDDEWLDDDINLPETVRAFGSKGKGPAQW